MTLIDARRPIETTPRTNRRHGGGDVTSDRHERRRGRSAEPVGEGPLSTVPDDVTAPDGAHGTTAPTAAAGVSVTVALGRDASMAEAVTRLVDALSEQSWPDHVLTLVVHALRPLGATGGVLVTVDDEGRITSVATAGSSSELMRSLGPLVIDGDYPIMAAIAGHTMWLGSRDDIARRFPEFAALPGEWGSYAVLPFRVGDRVTGGMAIPFAGERDFYDAERGFLLTVAALAARAVLPPVSSDDPEQVTPLLDRISDPVFLFDERQDRFVYANDAAVAFAGCDRDLLMRAPLSCILQQAHARLTPMAPNDDGPARRGGARAFDVELQLPDGSRRVAEVHVGDRDEHGRRVAVLVDLTARHERDLTRSSHRAQQALWRERTRVARDLHDGVVQSVFATSLTLAGVVQHAPEPLRQQIEDAIDNLDTVVQQLRATVFGLAQPQLDGAGPTDYLHSLVARSARSLGFTPDLRLVGRLDLIADELLGHILLGLREALSNVARHAKASSAEVTVDVRATEVHVQVADDGVGIDPEAPRGDGIDNLRRRAEELGGQFTVQPNSPSGTVVGWVLPMHRAPATV